MKRLICTIIGVFLVFFTSFVAAFTYEYQGQTLEYTLITGEKCQVAPGNSIKGGNQISGDLHIPSHVVYNDREITVVSIGEYAFSKNSNLISVEIPNSIISIQESAFDRCSSLTTIRMSDEIQTLGAWCFSFCSQLDRISLPETLKYMGDYCFWGCSNLKSITIPSLISEINDNCFGQCSALKNIHLPENLKRIGNESFYRCYSLSDVELPSNLIRIGNGGFKSCSHLKKIIIPESMETLGSECFAYSGLESVDLPSSLHSAGSQCFYECENLRHASVNAPIGSSCFYGCDLESLYLNSFPNYTESAYQSITTDTLIIGPRISRLILGVYVLPKGAASSRYEKLLLSCPKKIIIEDSDNELQIGWIKDSRGSDFQSEYYRNSPSNFYWGSPSWGSELTDLYVGRSLVGCEMETSSIVSLTLGSQLNTFSLGTELYDLSALDKLNYLNSLNLTPPIIGSVSTEQYQNLKIKVPTESLPTYMDNPIWKNFKNLGAEIPSSIDLISADYNTDTSTVIYDLKGANISGQISSLAPGIYIVRQDNTVKKIVVK